MKRTNIYVLAILLFMTACRGDELLPPTETETRGDKQSGSLRGFYLLNEGNMGQNKATLDYYDFEKALYTRNIYGAANPGMVQALGDVGNDLKVYGNRLYAVINCSNLIEVMDKSTAEHIGTIEIPNCRYLTFDGAYGYITSYAGPVQIGNKQIGYVAKFDTATLQIVDTCFVGYQPDEAEVLGNKLYVANSGGYLVPNYETKLSVIDLKTFEVMDSISVAINLHRVRKDSEDMLWVTSRGDYADNPARLFRVNPLSKQITDTFELAAGDLTICGDSLYYCGMDYAAGGAMSGIINTRTRQQVSTSIVTDNTLLDTPYGIAIHPDSGYVYMTDAGMYVNPGVLYCFSRDGKQLWNVRTGDIPAHIAFIYK